MLPKHKYLLTYRYSELIHDGTVEFCNRFLAEYKFKRTVEQMVQAARSGKQNIVEGVGQKAVSTSGEIKLLGVASASLEELISDYEDFLRQRNLAIWSKDDSRIIGFRQFGYHLSDLKNLSNSGNLIEKLVLPNSSEESANLLLTFCHLATFLLNRQIKAAEEKFIKFGGFSENLLKRRLKQINIERNSFK